MTMSEKMFNQGFDAFNRGVKVHENPFLNLGKRFEIKAIWWERGWKSALDEAMNKFIKI